MGEEVSLTCPNKASHGAGQREREENKEDIEHGNAYESRYAAENQLGSTDSNISSSFHARMAEGRGCRKGFASVVGWEWIPQTLIIRDVIFIPNVETELLKGKTLYDFILERISIFFSVNNVIIHWHSQNRLL